MNGSIRTYRIENSEVIKVIDTFNHDLIPTIRAMPEFVAFYVITKGSNTLTTVGIFDSAEGVRKVNQLCEETIRSQGALVTILTQPIDGEATIRITR